MAPIRVLLTDPDYSTTLGAVRCLGARRIECHVASYHDGPTLAAASRYCASATCVGSLENPDAFLAGLLDLLRSKRIDVLLPIGLGAHAFAVEHHDVLGRCVALPVVKKERFLIASRKDRTVRFAQEFDVAVPETVFPQNEEDLAGVSAFPVVVKASETLKAMGYAQNPGELADLWAAIKAGKRKDEALPIVQEYVPGTNGYGFYAFYWNGKLVAHYMHRRLHMFPRSGGASTMAETHAEAEVFRQGKLLLDQLQWHGVAMVEFKQHETNGKFYLIEINPKYWGSLELGLAAGAAFPYYHVMYALGRPVRIGGWRSGVRFLWPEKDLQYALSGHHPFASLVKWFMLCLHPGIKTNIRFTDIGPHLYYLRSFMANREETVRKLRGAPAGHVTK